MLRTIYMPNYEVDQARDEIDVIKREIEEQRSFYDKIMKNLQDEKSRFEEDQRVTYMMLKDEYTTHLTQLHDKEKYNQNIVSDHMETKHIFELEERAQSEENEQLRQQNQMLRMAIRSIFNDTTDTVNTAKNDYEHNSEEFSYKFREQIESHNYNMSVIRD